jgi:hypothetical protein
MISKIPKSAKKRGNSRSGRIPLQGCAFLLACGDFLGGQGQINHET